MSSAPTSPGTLLCELPGKALEDASRTRSGLRDGLERRPFQPRDLDAKTTSVLSKVNIASLSNTNS